MKSIVSLFLLISFFFFSFSQSTPQLSPKQWQQDYDALAQLIQTEHVRPYWLSPKEEIETLIAQGRERIAEKNLSPETRIVEMLTLIASIQDGHSSMRGSDRYEQFGYLPFTAEWFSDGLYIIRAHEDYWGALGGKIMAVEGMPIEEVMQKLRTVVPHANQSRFLKFSPFYLHLPGLLYGLGISDSRRKATFTILDKEGKNQQITFTHTEEEAEEKYVNVDHDLQPIPLYRQHKEKAYWLDYSPEEKLLYVNFNRVMSMKEESIWAFSQRLFELADEEEIEKCVIDIRENGGGNNALSTSLWHGIATHPKLNQSGKLFVITGYKTFSAAISFASYLELRTKAIFVGQKPCDYLNHPGDSEDFSLPHSGIRIGLSQLCHQSSFYQDERPALKPEHPIEISFADYMRGVDPVMEWIREYRHQPKPIATTQDASILGRYEFSPARRLEIREEEGKLFLSISHKLSSPLYKIAPDHFGTEVHQLEIKVEKNGHMNLMYPDGKIRSLSKLKADKPTATELVYAGKMVEAKVAFRQLQLDCPDCYEHKDHALAALALEVLYVQRPSLGEEIARSRARAILNMAIRLNPEDHGFAEESLRYY